MVGCWEATVKGVGCCKGLLGVAWYGMVGVCVRVLWGGFRRLGKVGDAF
jgi:hypothetical protein